MGNSILLLTDNDLSHNIPLVGIAKLLSDKGHEIFFCGSCKNEYFFQNSGFNYVSSTIFAFDSKNTASDVNFGFFNYETLSSISKGKLDYILFYIKPLIVIIPYYISYLLPFLKEKYGEFKFCCTTPLLRGELFTPKYLFNFHYDYSSDFLRNTIVKNLETDEKCLNDMINYHYGEFKEFILCPSELDISDKYAGQNVEYSQAFIGNQIVFNKTLEKKDNLIVFSMGSNSMMFPLVINGLVEKIIKCFKILKEYDPTWKVIFSVPEDIVQNKSKFLEEHEDIEFVNWFDQSSLLMKSRLMITHGGIGSIKECILSLTPMLCLPLTRDQPYNSKRIENLGLGKVEHPIKSSVESIYTSILDLIEEKSFVGRLMGFRNVFRNYHNNDVFYNQLMGIINK